jgi:signal transduction histidine kinase
MLSFVEEQVGLETLALFTRTDGGVFAPLAYHGPEARESIRPGDPLIELCWRKASPVTASLALQSSQPESAIAVPLRLGPEVFGVLVARGPTKGDLDLTVMQPELDELSLRLATALTFEEIRSMVTTDERQRLAREIHDGVAQDVASIGYALDELAQVAHEPDVSEGLRDLRRELSRVVTELRLSIFDLRAGIGDGPGLGAALSDYVRAVGARSSMTVHLTLDESPARLSPSVETELFRIAQEAITNARKHSGAEHLWVNCWVRSPCARIEISDDGRGLGVGRADSYGLRIMRERAERIKASVKVERASDEVDRPGTCVTIAVGDEQPPALKRVGMEVA